ncbi:hypothetical protein JCM10450v2_005894 [Rhodotorula kratochvilovae]
MSSPPQEAAYPEPSTSETNDRPPAQRSQSSPSAAHLVPDQSTNSESSNPKPRRTRKHVSCEGCRQRKVKCSREQTCTNCRLRNQPCIYVDAEPLPVDDSASYEDQLADARAEIDRLRAEVARLTAERDLPLRGGGGNGASSTASSFNGAHLALAPGMAMYPPPPAVQRTPRPAAQQVPMAQYPLDAPDQYALANHPFAHFAQQQRERASYAASATGEPPAAGMGMYHPAAVAPAASAGGFGAYATRARVPLHPYAYALAPAAPPAPYVPSWAYAPLPTPTALAAQRAYAPFTPAVGSDPYYRSLRHHHGGGEGEDVENGADEYAALPPPTPHARPMPQVHGPGWATGDGAAPTSWRYAAPAVAAGMAVAAAVSAGGGGGGGDEAQGRGEGEWHGGSAVGEHHGGGGGGGGGGGAGAQE